MFLTNVAAAVAFDAQPQIDDARKDKNNIEQSIHRNLSSGNTKFHHNPKVGILDITKFINRSVIE